MRIEPVGIEKRATLLDGEDLLPRDHDGIKVTDRELGQAAPLPPHRRGRRAGAPGRSVDMARTITQRAAGVESPATSAFRHGAKSAAKSRPMAAAMRAKSSAGTRTMPNRNAAPQWVLLRMKVSASISGRIGAGVAGR